MSYKVGVIRGDGIGPEIVAEALKVLDKVAEKYNETFDYTDIRFWQGVRSSAKRGILNDFFQSSENRSGRIFQRRKKEKSGKTSEERKKTSTER